jgi:hypothetical protein
MLVERMKGKIAFLERDVELWNRKAPSSSNLVSKSGGETMATTTQERRDVEVGRNTRKYGLPALLLSAIVSFVLGWFGGQGVEKNNVDNIPGGQPTDSVSGTSTSDR